MKTVSKKLLSLLLVMVLLLSAVPFQAFATEPDDAEPNYEAFAVPYLDETEETEQDSIHNMVTRYNAKYHWSYCTHNLCLAPLHNFEYAEHDFSEELEAKVDATCLAGGTTAVMGCAECDATTGGDPIEKLNHEDTNGDGICDNGCNQYIGEGENATVNFVVKNPYTGEVTTTAVNGVYKVAKTITSVPESIQNPKFDECVFGGWFVDEACTKALLGNDVKAFNGMNVYAKLTPNTITLKIWVYKDGSFSKLNITGNPYALNKHDLKNKNNDYTTALTYVNKNLGDAVEAYADGVVGYEWDGKWYNYNNPNGPDLTKQDILMNNDVDLFIRLKAVGTYKLSFDTNAPAGTASLTKKPDSMGKGSTMTVTFNKKVGTLPAASCEGYVFQGWNTKRDGTGDDIDKDTVYKIDGDTTLYAQWKAEAKVELRIYVNGTTNHKDVVMHGYVTGDNVTYAEVKSKVNEFYHGYTMDGLFTASSWAQYKSSKNNSLKGVQLLEVMGGENVIYVRLHDAVSGAASGSNSSSKPTDSSLPKTGDTTMIYGAVSVMVLAAAALVTVQTLRKKKVL